MEVDEGALWTAPSQHPLSPPRELRVAGKRRRLNDVDDEDQRELAELSQLVDEDEAGNLSLALKPSAASTIPASVLSMFVHNVQHFQCTLCTYTAASFASLTRHRVSRHRRIAFMDRFSAVCACGLPFASRLAAATHAQACASLSSTILATASTTGGASSHTVVGTTATVSAVAIVVPALPRQDVSEPTASPPLLPAPRWCPPLPREVVAFRIADRLVPSTPDVETPDSPPDVSELTSAASSSMATPGTTTDEWLLRFDGACRANPGPGGAGAALFHPNGPVVWTTCRAAARRTTPPIKQRY
ncbi:unnamed protein product [Peronospora effusa]|nr:unnamed protein product [Peronospora effusa]